MPGRHFRDALPLPISSLYKNTIHKKEAAPRGEGARTPAGRATHMILPATGHSDFTVKRELQFLLRFFFDFDCFSLIARYSRPSSVISSSMASCQVSRFVSFTTTMFARVRYISLLGHAGPSPSFSRSADSISRQLAEPEAIRRLFSASR